MPDDISLMPCPMCGGIPVVLVEPRVIDHTLRITCSECGITTGGFAFSDRQQLLPDLATARRQAARYWNERVVL